MTQNVLISGFGGQGVMSMGQMLCHGGMMQGSNVSWLPSYGPEMRGGSAYCMVVLSDEPVAAPIFPNANCVMAMNLPSLDKFEKAVLPGGNLLINSSLIHKKAQRSDISVHYIPANDIAAELGNPRVAGMVMIGAFLKLTGALTFDSIEGALKKVFGGKKANLVPLNMDAIRRGAGMV